MKDGLKKSWFEQLEAGNIFNHVGLMRSIDRSGLPQPAPKPGSPQRRAKDKETTNDPKGH